MLFVTRSKTNDMSNMPSFSLSLSLSSPLSFRSIEREKGEREKNVIIPQKFGTHKLLYALSMQAFVTKSTDSIFKHITIIANLPCARVDDDTPWLRLCSSVDDRLSDVPYRIVDAYGFIESVYPVHLLVHPIPRDVL